MKKRILFVGQGKSASNVLSKLYFSKNNYEIIGVVPRLVRSKKKIKKKIIFFDKGIINKTAKELNLKIFNIEDINSKLFVKKLQILKPDLLVNLGHGQLFKKDLLSISKFGTLNYHPGLLPYGRGSGAVVGEIINGANKIGRTCHLMDEKFDMGRIVSQETIKIKKNQTMTEISLAINKNIDKFVLNAIKKVFLKKMKNKKLSFGRYFPKFVEGDEYINWNENSNLIHRKIQSRLSERYSITFLKDSLQEIKVVNAHIEKKIKPYISVNGQIIDKSKNGILVKTSDTAIWITSIVSSKNKIIIPNFNIGTCFQTVNIKDFISLMSKLKKK